MEIQKIFSNVEDEGEKLYSVLISEEEIREFSEYLDQKEYVSKREAKKLAKKTAKIEQDFQTATKAAAGDATKLSQAQAVYESRMGKEVLNKKNAGKIIDATGPAPIVKAIKNDRAAEQIAGALGNGDAKVKAETAQKLKKSAGGKGLNVSEHVAAGNYNPEGVKANVIATANSNAALKTRVNGANVRAAKAEKAAQNAKIEAEAKVRKMEAETSRKMEQLANRGKSTYQPYQHKNGYAPKKAEGILGKVTRKLGGMSTKGKVGLAAGAALATAGTAYGIHKATKKD